MKKEKSKICKWKDGKYEPCKAAYEHYIDLGKPYDPYWNNKIQRGYEVNFCPFCGADIRKPEPGHSNFSINIVDVLEKSAGYKIDKEIKESILCLFDLATASDLAD